MAGEARMPLRLACLAGKKVEIRGDAPSQSVGRRQRRHARTIIVQILRYYSSPSHPPLPSLFPACSSSCSSARKWPIKLAAAANCCVMILKIHITCCLRRRRRSISAGAAEKKRLMDKDREWRRLRGGGGREERRPFKGAPPFS